MNRNEELKTFCGNVKLIREKLGFSKEKMAKIAGISVKSLSAIENGTVPKRLSVKMLINIYNNLGVHPTFFFEKHNTNE